MKAIENQWYLKRLEEVQKNPGLYQSWRVENGILYKNRKDELLDLMTQPEKG